MSVSSPNALSKAFGAPNGRILFAVSLAACLASCGGGGGTDNSSAAATSQAPAAVVCASSSTATAAPTFNGKQTIAICANVFLDPSIAVTDRPSISTSINNATQRDKTYYGSLVAAPPDVIVCASTECATYFAGPSLRNTSLIANSYVAGASYVAPRATIILTGLASDTENVLTHEGSHVELAARIGSGSVPAWFNEGLATNVGGAPNCVGVSSRAFADLRQVDDQLVWNAQTNSAAVFLPAYCQARSEVMAWVGAHSAGSVVSLLSAVKAGMPFYTAYGPFLTQ